MTRRRTEKPVERLRSSWTSTADLEETIAAMFPHPPDNLTCEPPDILPGATTAEPPDKLPCVSGHNSVDKQLNNNELQAETPDILTDHISIDPPDKLPVVNMADPGSTTPAILTGQIYETQPTIPPDNLTEPPPARLTTEAPDKLPHAPTDNLASGFEIAHPIPPPDNLSVIAPGQITAKLPPDNLTGIVYQTLDGVIVDAKCIRPYDNVRSAHTPSEHMVYVTMWKMLGSRDDDGTSREGILPMSAVAAKASISLRNLRRVLRSLEQKLAIEVTGYEDKTRSIPRRYRVWGFNSTVERRHRAGYSFVYRNRNLITLARPYAPAPSDKLPSAQRSI